MNKAALGEPLFRDRLETGSPLYYVVAASDTAIKDEGFPSEVLEVDPGTFVPSKPSAFEICVCPEGSCAYVE